MKIWIDFINTPQVSFFIPFIEDLEKRSTEILLTCRESGNTVELLKQNNLKFTIIGRLGGSNTLRKLLYFPLRVYLLFQFLRRNKPDLAVGQSSFYLPIVSFLLRIPSIYTNDNEHAKGNILGFIFSKTVILPKVLKNEPYIRNWPFNRKIIFYEGVKEGIYLSQNKTLLGKAEASERKIIYFRPEPWSAQYYKGPQNFFDEILIQLASKYKIVVLPRDKNQKLHYQQKQSSNLTVSDKSIPFSKILESCMLFIGAGGSMTRELAVMGVPVISIYQDNLLKVDEYLIENGMMINNPKISFPEIERIIENTKKQSPSKSILNEGILSFNLIKSQILNIENEKN